MPSSPIVETIARPDRISQLLDLLVKMPDPRDPRGVRYQRAGMLAVAVSAVLTGAQSFAAIGAWGLNLGVDQLGRLGLEQAPVEH